MNLNNKGFTLVEVLAVVALIAVLGLIAIPSVISTITTGKETSYEIMIDNIITASQSLYEEIEYGIELYQYDTGGATTEKIQITSNQINTNLQTLVSNGFLKGTNSNCNTPGCNKKILINPKNSEDIGDCQITIVYTDGDYKVTKNDTNSKCPDQYKEVKNG